MVNKRFVLLEKMSRDSRTVTATYLLEKFYLWYWEFCTQSYVNQVCHRKTEHISARYSACSVKYSKNSQLSKLFIRQ